MRPTWLIECGVYGEEATPLLDEIRQQGMVAEVVPHQALRAGAVPVVGGQPVPPDGCEIGYGTFPFAQQILRHHRWVPGAWCSAANLDCATYFAYFSHYLLNQQYAIVPGIDRDSFATALAPSRYDPTTLIVVAAPQPTAREWRLVVVGDRVVAGSQYAVDGQRSIVAHCPSEVHEFAETMPAEVRWRPAPPPLLSCWIFAKRRGSCV